MDGYNRLDVLLRKCESIREHINSFKEFVDLYDANNAIHFTQIQMRLQVLVSNYSNIEDLYDEINLIDTEELRFR